MNYRRYIQKLHWLLIGAFLLSACNFPIYMAEDNTLPMVDTGEETGSEGSDGESSAAPTEEPQVPTDTPEPTPTATLEPPTDTPEPEACTNIASFVSDVTYPDDTEVDAEASFTKTWRLRNDGNCTWTSSYDLVFSHGDRMDAPVEAALAGAVPPGSTVDISSTMTAPTDPGTYQGFWKLRSDEGVLFGVGSGGGVAFWAKIVVPDEEGFIVEVIPMFEGYHLVFIATGKDVVVHDNACYDLDEGEGVSCGAAGADFQYEYSHILFTHDYEIDPMNGTRFRLFGSEAPNREQCQAMSLSAATFELHKRYYCFQTGDGNYGWLLIDNYNSSSVLFDFVTFNEP